MPRIAHISDIHFGPTFDFDTWKNVRKRIVEFGPTILIASGDFVDEPDPFDLLVAKCELLDLCAEIKPEPQLFVVPGNHDVLEIGNVPNPLRSRSFERIMFSDTTAARAKLEKSLGITLGLNSDSLLSLRGKLKRLLPQNSIRLNVSKKSCDGRMQSRIFHACGRIWPIEITYDQVEIACFNSNPQRSRLFAFATGEVDGSQVTRLGQTPRVKEALPEGAASAPHPDPASSANGAVILRIAVLHHHPLPIALSKASRDRQRGESRLEQFLVLRNSGDLLHRLQRDKFDLVLHGHKHKAQLARIELEADGLERYPLLILAGGSAAKRNEENADNTLRLIETKANGRLTIRVIENGEKNERPEDVEPIETLKSRIHRRARERTRRIAENACWSALIDPVGHLHITERAEKLRSLDGGEEIAELPVRIVVPSYVEGFEDHIEPTEDSSGRVSIWWRTDDRAYHKLGKIPHRERGCCCMKIHEPLKPGSSNTLSYGVKYAVTNGIAMTRWELDEKRRRDDDLGEDGQHEFVSKYLSYPVERFTMKLQLPADLHEVVPEFYCKRHRNFPAWPLGYRFDERPATDNEFSDDADIAGEEKDQLFYDRKTEAWCFTIKRPLPGYRYGFRWKVPEIRADPRIIGRTMRYQQLLLEIPGRLGTPQEKPFDRECYDLFCELAKALMHVFSSQIVGENQSVFLMVYNPESGHLHAALSYPPSAVPQDGSFKVPLGAGIAGAAMVRRQVVVWNKLDGSTTLIRPVPLPGMKVQHVLALPVFCPSVGDPGDESEFESRPGGVVGVVTLGSDDPSSGIIKCSRDEGSSRQAQVVAQRAMVNLLSKAHRPPALSPERKT